MTCREPSDRGRALDALSPPTLLFSILPRAEDKMTSNAKLMELSKVLFIFPLALSDLTL